MSATIVVFFFQAEDGIRGRTVTGVQTCARPISSGTDMGLMQAGLLPTIGWRHRTYTRARSEERRVGKECRSWGSPYHEKKKKEKKNDMQLYYITFTSLIFYYTSHIIH